MLRKMHVVTELFNIADNGIGAEKRADCKRVLFSVVRVVVVSPCSHVTKFSTIF